MTDRGRAVALAALVALSAAVGLVGLGGTAAAASNVSISPADQSPDATTTYTVEGDVDLANQDTLQHVDVHLGPADASAVTESDVTLFVDGDEYSDGLSQFDSTDGTVEFKLGNSQSVSDGDPIRIELAGVTNPGDDFDATATLHDSGDAEWQTFADSVTISEPDDPDPSPTPPTISDFALDATADGELSLYFRSSERLEDVAVSVSGPESRTLTGEHLDERVVDGAYTYSLIWDAPAGGYAATLDRAVDADGDDGASGQSSTATVAFPPVAIGNATVDPAALNGSTTVANQQVTVDVVNLSADGDTDTMSVEFPNALADSLSANGVSVTNTSVAQSPEVVDGFDGDSVQDTVRFQTDVDGGGAVNATVTVDVSVAYPATERDYPIDVRVADSTGHVATENGTAAVTVRDRLAIERFDATVAADGTLNVSLAASERLESLYVALSGPEADTLSLADFTSHEVAVGVGYTASLAGLAPGDYRLTLGNATDERNRSVAPNHTATATVLGTGHVEAHVGAAPPAVGDGSATHTAVARVTADSALANRTLTGVTVGYGAAFHEAGGSVTSVSDDQNVVTLRVVGPDGTETAALGDTDEVDVNVVNGAVRLDLSDVDSARAPTLAPGDRVVVGLRPATNPAEPGRYDVNVTLRGPAGAADEATATLDVLAAEGVENAGSARLSLDSPAATVAFGAGPLTSVTVEPTAETVGWVSVRDLADPPVPVESVEGDVVSVIDVRTPAPSEAATLSVSLDAAAVDADRLKLVRYGNPSWEQVGTASVDATDGTLTVSAAVDHTSTFAVVAADAESTATETVTATVTETATATDTTAATATATDTPAGTTTATESGGAPGFTVGVALAALVAAAALWRRR